MSHNQNTKISDETFNKLVSYANTDDVSVSHIVRQAIKRYIADRENGKLTEG